jgi:hypothetical protein
VRSTADPLGRPSIATRSASFATPSRLPSGRVTEAQTEIVKPGLGHDPGLDDPTAVIEFIAAHAE